MEGRGSDEPVATYARKRQCTGNHGGGTGDIPASLESLTVRLSALSLVTKAGSGSFAHLAPLVGRDRNARLVDLADKIVVVSVRDTVRALPVFEVIVEWQREQYTKSMSHAGLIYREHIGIHRAAEVIATHLPS